MTSHEATNLRLVVMQESRRDENERKEKDSKIYVDFKQHVNKQGIAKATQFNHYLMLLVS